MTTADKRPLGWSVADGGDPTQLTGALRTIRDLGYGYAELIPDAWGIWMGGHLNPSRLTRWAQLLKPFENDLRFTMHASAAINPGQGETDDNLLRACAEAAVAVGAQTLVIHPFRQSMNTVSYTPLTEKLAREREAIQNLAERFRPSGLRLALETYTPPTKDEYCYAAWPEQLARQVKLIDHPNVGICIDSGHLFISAQFCGFDFEEAVELLKPQTIHTHIQDTLGQHDPTNSWLGNEPTGIGDAHLPPGFGRIPLQALASLPDGVPLLAELSRIKSLDLAAQVHQDLTTLARTADITAAAEDNVTADADRVSGRVSA